MIETLWQDVRYALRSLRRTPAFTAAAILTLALGIAATTAIFTVVNAVLLKPLPYPDADRIVMLVTTTPEGSIPVDSAAGFEAWQRAADILEDVSAYRFTGVNVTDVSEPEQVLSIQVSDDFFNLFGTSLSAGRTFTADEHRGRGARTVILTDGFWRRRFASDPRAVGRTISLDGRPHVIVGILGARFDLRTLPLVPKVPSPDVVVPLPPSEGGAPVRYLVAAGRLTPAVTLADANSQARRRAEAFRREFPNEIGARDSFGVEPIEDAVVGNTRASLLILFAAVGFVLLIACANVANLLLVRGSVRQREIAIRRALGATSGRVVRQLLTESAILSVTAGSIGLVCALTAVRLLLTMNPQLPRIWDDSAGVSADWRVLLFAAAMAISTGLAFGMLPAFRARGTNVTATINDHRSTGGRSPFRARRALVVIETALALVLLIGAALLIRSFVALRAVEPGFESAGVLNVPMTLAGVQFETTSEVARIVRDGVARLRDTPGVVTAATGCCVPMLGRYQLPFIIPGRPLIGASHGMGGWVNVSPGYFDVFRLPLIRGRAFTDFDAGGAPGVVVINQVMARRFWPNGDPLNDRLLIGQGFGPAEEAARQIVGIVGDVPDGGLDGDPVPMMYVPTAQMSDGYTALHSRVPLLWFVRTDVEPHSLVSTIRRELQNAAGGVPVGATMIRSMDQLVAESTIATDFQTALMTIFAWSAMLLAALGVYGVTAYSVQQRTQEIGVRLALGAEPRQVRNMVLAEGLALTLLGIAVGTASAFAVSRVIAGFLFGVTARDPAVFIAAPTLLASVALVAVWLPARRAARLSPAIVLRAD